MPRINKTRVGTMAQKKEPSLAVVDFLEADIIGDGTGTGSVFIQLPPDSIIQKVTSNITVASGTAGATVDVLANNVVLVNELAVAAAGVGDETIIDAARALPTGGELVIRIGATPPATGNLVGQIVVEYVETKKNNGEYTRHLAS